jgi:hypothetical protein
MKFKYRNQILAVFYALALFITGSANAGIIKMDAVKTSYGDFLSFAAFDDTLGTLKNVKLYYSISMWLRIVNDYDTIEDYEWSASVNVGISDVFAGSIVDMQYHVITHELVENRFTEMYRYEFGGVADVQLDSLSRGFGGVGLSISESALDTMLRDLTDEGAHCEDSSHCFGGNITASRLEYQYEVGAVKVPDATSVPEPSTLAIFALGLMGLASRRFKNQS